MSTFSFTNISQMAEPIFFQLWRDILHNVCGDRCFAVISNRGAQRTSQIHVATTESVILEVKLTTLNTVPEYKSVD